MAADDLDHRQDDLPDNLFREALRWHARMRDGGANDKTKREFERWLDRDRRHADAYAEAGRLWLALAQPTKTVASENREEIARLVRTAWRRKSQRKGRVAIAGISFLALIIVGDWWRRGGFDDLQADYVTRAGASRHDVLADGSEITLNTDTSVAVDLQPNERRVRIFRGEAFFNVAGDAARPFVVTTADGATRAVGTAFNIRKRNEGTVISLVSGRVNVSTGGGASAVASLEAGEEVDLDRSQVGRIRPFDADSVTAWRRGQVVFFQTPLGKVVEELNRYRWGRIVIVSDRLRSLPVTGVFDARRPAEAISIIETTLGVSAIRITDALVLLR